MKTSILTSFKVRRIFTFSETREAGTYKPCIHEGRRTAIVICPLCQSKLVLNPHLVGADGEVSPSVVCRPPCAFHEFIILVGWESLNLVKGKDNES
jgi:hypothetical protein